MYEPPAAYISYQSINSIATLRVVRLNNILLCQYLLPGNDTLHVDGTPLMHQVAYEAAKKVSSAFDVVDFFDSYTNN